MTELTTPPEAVQIEACLLGAMLLSPEHCLDAVGQISEQWLFRPEHQTMFRVMCEMCRRGERVGPVNFRQELRDRGEYDRVCGDERLCELIKGTPHSYFVDKTYVRVLREKWLKREEIRLGQTLVTDGYDSLIDGQDIMDDAYSGLQAIAAEQDDDTGASGAEAVQAVLEHAEKVARGEIPLALATGYPQLDRELLNGGFRPGELVIVAADTSVGKSIVACDLIRHTCELGRGAVMASAEMTYRSVMSRILAAESNVPINAIRRGRYTPGESEAIQQAKGRISGWKLDIRHGGRMIGEIAARASRLNDQWGGKLGLVVVDYLQIMRPEEMQVNREQQVGMMAMRCKEAAMEMQVPWVAMAQFNRLHHTQNRSPAMSDIRDSSQVEQHTDIVILLHPHKNRVMEPGTPAEGLGYYEIAMYIPKNREGGTHACWKDAAIRKVRRFVGRTDP